MLEREQYVPWQEASIGYWPADARRLRVSSVWADPKLPYRDCARTCCGTATAVELGYASAAAIADFIIANMVAEVAPGSRSPKEAAERAQKRAERYYKV